MKETKMNLKKVEGISRRWKKRREDEVEESKKKGKV